MSEIEQFLAALSSAEPVPGGGSVAALQVALGASLLCMVANLTLGKGRYAEVQDQVHDILTAAVVIRDRAARLIDEDSEAYGQVGRALSLPKETGDERARRTQAVQEALKAAARPPLETMRAAVECVHLADRLVDIGNRSAVSDVATAALCARSGYEAGRLNVEINLEAVRDEVWVGEQRTELAATPSVERLEVDVVRRAQAIIQKKSA